MEGNLFDLPKEDHQRMFLYQSGSEDRGDVLLTNMNSAVEDIDLGSVEASPEKEMELMEEETPRPASPVNTLETVETLNGSMLGPAVDSLEREEVREEVKSLVRSHSSPDLVTEGSGSDWTSEAERD